MGVKVRSLFLFFLFCYLFVHQVPQDQTLLEPETEGFLTTSAIYYALCIAFEQRPNGGARMSTTTIRRGLVDHVRSPLRPTFEQRRGLFAHHPPSLECWTEGCF
jgi:hypothetical protein